MIHEWLVCESCVKKLAFVRNHESRFLRCAETKRGGCH